MSNMSYCRFHNTNLDVQDCLETLRGLVDLYGQVDWLERNEYPGSDEELEEAKEEFMRNQLSQDESRAAYQMIDAILETLWELDIVVDYSRGELSNLMAKIGK